MPSTAVLPVLTRPLLGRTLAYSIALNSGVALVLWLLVPAMGALWPIWVRSQCIGGSITALALGIGLLPGVHRLAGLRAVAVMLLPAVPLGYLIGKRLSGWLLDDPAELGWGAEVTTGAILATVLASALAGLVLWGRQRIRGEEVARQQAQRLAAEAELRLLRAQLEPHMLFNTLANLRELMAENPPAAQVMLDSFIVFLRHTLAATRQARTTLEQELNQLHAYLSLMSMRMGPRLHWHVDLPEALRAVALPPMLLQPLVENAIQHGLEPQRGPGTIRVSAAREGRDIVVTVVDSGRGLPDVPTAPATAQAPAGGSYGLAHVRERLQAEYGARGRLELQAHLPQGVRACVRFPPEDVGRPQTGRDPGATPSSVIS